MFEQMSLTTCTFETKNCGTLVSENAALELSIFAALMLSDNKRFTYAVVHRDYSSSEKL